MALHVTKPGDNIEAAIARSSTIINDPAQTQVSRAGKGLKDLVPPEKLEKAFYEPLNTWSAEIWHKFLNAVNPVYKNIDELLMTDIMLARDMIEINITDDPHVPLEQKLLRLNNKHYNQFAQICFNFGIVNKHLLMYKHKLKNKDIKQLSWVTNQETINIDVNKVQVPKLYPTTYYRKYYKMVIDTKRGWDRATKQPVFFFPNQGVYTTRPDIFILRCELIRVNPHLADKFLPLRKLEFGYYNLDNIKEFDMRRPPVSNETPDIDIHSRLMFVSAMKNSIPQLHLSVKLEYFYKHWKKTIDNLPRRENNGYKRYWNEYVLDIQALLEQSSRQSTVRSSNNKAVNDKLFKLLSLTKAMFNANYISIVKYMNMSTDIEEFIAMNLQLGKVIKNS